MPAAKLKALNSDVMKPEEGNDSLDTFIRQTIGKEPFLSFPRTSDSPVQWIQLLHALDQQDVGWPLLAPPKMQMQKCDKCSHEFFSSINQRRHMRVHHRLKKLDKDTSKNRDLLGAFWDKLSKDAMKEILSFKDVKLEDAMKEIFSFKNVKLEEGTGSSIVNLLANFLVKSGYFSVPQSCKRAGSNLLDIIQGTPTKFPLSTEELFGILDEASEKTFLCGTAVSMQKYIFDGEVGKIGLETKNLVAFIGFLVEQKLVKAWLADQDAEALRCQKLLVEEEEAAQKRQAEVLERKRQKKLRQKEQRAKDQMEEKKVDVNKRFDTAMEAVSLAAQSCPLATSDTDIHGSDTPPDHSGLQFESFQISNIDEDVVSENQIGSVSGYTDQASDCNVEQHPVQGSGRRHNVVSRWHMPVKSHRNHLPNGFNSGHNSQVPKLSIMQKHGSPRDLKPLPIVNGNRKWSRKPKVECSGECFGNGVDKEATTRPDHNKKCEVLIGSISVTLGNSSHHEGKNLDGAWDDCLVKHQMPKKNSLQGKHNRPDSGQCNANRTTVRLWRPVSQLGTKGTIVVENGVREYQVDGIVEEGEDQTQSTESCLSCVVDGNCMGIGNSSLLLEENLYPGSSLFSTEAARAFLAERWKQSIAAEHVKLILYQNFEQPGCVGVCQVAEAVSSESQSSAVLGNTENQLVNGGLHESNVGAGKAKFKVKHEKSVKLKYIPKHGTIT